MKTSFEDIDNHIISMKKFSLNWRFTEKIYNILPDEHLNQIKPYDKVGSKFLDDFIKQIKLHEDEPFKEGFFKTNESIGFGLDEEYKIKKWLYRRGFPFEKEVYLSWDIETGLKVPWKILIKYFDDFFYPGPDDLSVFDESLNWAILFFHESEIYFGTNEKYKLDKNEPADNKRL